MRTCDSCQQHNPPDARFCLRCGEKFLEEPVASPKPPEVDQPAPGLFDQGAETMTEESGPESLTEEQYWQVLIGRSPCLQFAWSGGWSWKPAWEYYQRVFRHFHSAEGPRFALTWNWSPFFIEPFLWFLYRKMYLFALVYLIGPVISVYLTGDVTVPLVWSVIASTSANYVYYWHLKDIFIRVKQRTGMSPGARRRELADAGGVQPYVLWLVAASVLLKIVVIVVMMGGPPLESELPLPQEEEGAGSRQVF